jgi:predicted Zn-dependent peptidase
MVEADSRTRTRRRVAWGVVFLAVLLAVRIAAPWERAPRPAPRPPPGSQHRPPPAPPEPAGAEPGAEAIEPDVHPFRGAPAQLGNGLTVILIEDRSAPTIAAHVAVGVGSAHDPLDHPGTAHLLEHMMFKGTSRLSTTSWPREAPWREREAELLASLASEPDAAAREVVAEALEEVHARADAPAVPNELARALAEIGATGVNAVTTPEYTAYSALLPANRLEPWAHLMAEQLSDPVWRGFPNERRVVQDEIALRSDHVSFATTAEVRSRLFGDHPYGRPIGGRVADLAASHPAVLEAFWHEHYVPSNMVVVLVGDFDRGQALDAIAATFGAMPPDDRVAPTLPPILAEPTATRMVNGTRKEVEVHWAATDLAEGEDGALEVAARVVASEARGRLVGVGVRLTRAEHAMIVSVSGMCLGEAAGCERALLRAVERVRAGAVDEADVQAAVRNHHVRRLEELESHTAQAVSVVSGWARGEPLRARWSALQRLAWTTPDEVVAAARRHLRPGSAVVTVPGARSASDSDALSEGVTSRLDDDRASLFYEEVVTWPVPPLAPSWVASGRDYVAVPGLVAVPNPSNTLFDATLRYPTGWRTDPLVCLAVQLFGGQWSRRQGVHGVTGTFSCDGDEVRVRLKGPGERARATLEGLGPAMRGARLAPNESEIISQSVWFRMRSDAVVGWALYGARSPWRVALPPSEALTGATGTALGSALGRLAALSPELTYAGPHSPGAVASMIAWAPMPPPDNPPLAPLHRTTILLARPSPYGQVRAFRVGGAHDPGREGLYALYEAWLTGTSGAVFEAVRDGVGGSYDPRVDVERGRVPGSPVVTTVSSGFRRGTEPAALARVLHQVLTTERVGQETWLRIRETALARTAHEHLSYRELGPRVQRWRDLGFGEDDPRELAFLQLQELDRGAFEAFLAEEARHPIVLEVPLDEDDPRVEALRALGDVFPRDAVVPAGTPERLAPGLP